MTIGLKDEHYRVCKFRCPVSGVIAEERWETPDGQLHNPDGPALICRNPENGIVTTKSFWIDNGLHRLGGEPAHQEFDELSGNCFYRSFSVDGIYARPDGLPHAEYIDSETGIVYQAEYRIAGKRKPALHRTDGPALITYDRSTGEQTGADHYANGRKRASSAFPDPSLE